MSSRDQRTTEEFDSLADLRSRGRDVSHPLAAYALDFFAPEFGLEIETCSESPAGAGISGSSALLIAICAGMNELTGRGLDREQLRMVAQNLEARAIRVPTGCQDYYPALYGGVSAIGLRPDGVHREAVDIDTAELDSRFVLAYTGAPRNSGINNWEVMKAHIDGNREVQGNFDTIAAIANGMRCALGRSDWAEAGRLLREEWNHRRCNFKGVSTPLIDRLIDGASAIGAVGGKVCGAGGGGCVLLLIEPEARPRVEAFVRDQGASVLPARAARDGVRVDSA